jgi:hypothetical protein
MLGLGLADVPDDSTLWDVADQQFAVRARDVPVDTGVEDVITMRVKLVDEPSALVQHKFGNAREDRDHNILHGEVLMVIAGHA